MAAFGKHYVDRTEYARRQEIFAKNDKFITEWNRDPKNSSTVGHNKFSDWDD